MNGNNGEVARWASGIAYTAGFPVINPDGDLVKVITAHTAGATYDATKFSLPRGFGGANILPAEFGAAAGWTRSTTNTPSGATVSFATTTTRYLATSNSAGFIPLDGNKFYRYTFDIHSDIAGQVTYIDVNWKNAAGTALGSTPRILTNYTIPANVWTPISDQAVRLTVELGATADSVVFDAIEISRA